MALALLAGASTWVLKEISGDDEDSDSQTGHIADFYMENFSITVMDENGQPKRKVSAEYMAHFADKPDQRARAAST